MTSLHQVWVSVANFIPDFIGAVIVFIVGWVVAVSLGKIVEQVVKAVRLDHFLMRLEVEKTLERAGFRLDSGVFLGGLVKWFLAVAFLLASVDILGLDGVEVFLTKVLSYIPHVVVAALILIIAALVSSAVEKIVRGSVEAAGYRGALVGAVSRWAIWIFAFLAALDQLQIAEGLVRTLETGLVYGVALALAISFGLGGKEAAAGWLERLKVELRK